MAWSSKLELLDSSSIGATEILSEAVNLATPDEIVHIQAKVTFGGTTDDAVVNVYASIDPRTYSDGATIANGGSGYAVDDVLTVVGGTFGTAAQFVVTSVSGTIVDGIALLTEGDYSVTPANPVATTVSPAGGTGCTLNVSWVGDNWDTEEIETKTLTAISGSKLCSFSVADYRRVRVGVVGGGTDTHAALVWARRYSRAL